MRALLQLVSSVEAPRDVGSMTSINAVRELGQRWFIGAGGRRKQLASGGTSYAQYVALSTRHLADDVEQIRKDVVQGRTSAECFGGDGVEAFLAQMAGGGEAVKAALVRVLTAFVQRNPHVGYCQGMNQLAMFLLAFMAEEQTFWALCGVLEDLRPHDYYSPSPAMLNGFQADSKVFAKLLVASFPRLVEYMGADSVEMIGQLLASKFFLVVFISQTELRTLMCVFDCFLGASVDCSGELALFRAGLAYVALAERDILAGDDALRSVLDLCLHLEPETVLPCMLSTRFALDAQMVDELRDEARRQQVARWNHSNALFKRLTRATEFSEEELRGLQASFLALCEAKDLDLDQGVSREAFQELIERLSVAVEPETVDRVFSLYDWDNSGFVDFKELCCALSVLMRGSVEQRMRLCFDIFDADSNGFLDFEEIEHMASSLFRMIAPGGGGGGGGGGGAQQEQGRPSLQRRASTKELIDDLQSFKAALIHMDVDRDGRLSFDEFMDGARLEPRIVGCFQVDDERARRFMASQSKAALVDAGEAQGQPSEETPLLRAGGE